MKIDQEILQYLKGTAFKNTLKVEIGKQKYSSISRENAITEIIKGKDIIHLGCSDHLQIIKEKIRINRWLHKLLTDNSKRCIGIDLDKESIDFISKELGYKNVYHGNILTDDFSIIKETRWDYVVFGEILEHIDDPVNFLRVFKEKYGENVEKFIITVPNIYNKQQYRNMMNHVEIINSDHRFWFTPYTITKILTLAGYNPEKISYSNLQSLKIQELIIRKIKLFAGIKMKYPFYFFNTIIISGKIK